MPAKGKGASSKKSVGSVRRKAKPEKNSPKGAGETAPTDEPSIPKRDAETFTRGVLIRGEAARPDENGELPAGATHEIVGEDEEGMPVIERRRYSAF